MPAHAIKILVYAIKYDFGKLMNEAIPYLARSELLDVLRQVPDAYTVPWVSPTMIFIGVLNLNSSFYSISYERRSITEHGLHRSKRPSGESRG